MPDFIDRLRLRRHVQPGGLSCRELVELVTDYLEDALSPEDRRRFEQHVGMCEDCTVYVEQMRMTLELTGAIAPESISPQAEADLRAAFRDWHARSGGGGEPDAATGPSPA